jgi:hypothetical protein
MKVFVIVALEPNVWTSSKGHVVKDVVNRVSGILLATPVPLEILGFTQLPLTELLTEIPLVFYSQKAALNNASHEEISLDPGLR